MLAFVVSVKDEFRVGRGGHTVPTFCNHLLFFNHLQADDISISLASSKSRVSPLKALIKSKILIRFHYQFLIKCKNGQNLKIVIEIIRQKLIVSKF